MPSIALRCVSLISGDISQHASNAEARAHCARRINRLSLTLDTTPLTVRLILAAHAATARTVRCCKRDARQPVAVTQRYALHASRVAASITHATVSASRGIALTHLRTVALARAASRASTHAAPCLIYRVPMPPFLILGRAPLATLRYSRAHAFAPLHCAGRAITPRRGIVPHRCASTSRGLLPSARASRICAADSRHRALIRRRASRDIAHMIAARRRCAMLRALRHTISRHACLICGIGIHERESMN